LYEDPIYNDAFVYSFGFHGYFKLIHQLSVNVDNQKMMATDFTSKDNKKPQKPIFKKMYYPKFIHNTTNIVKNDCNLNKNMVLSGPNASGKTTTLKSILINIVLSQQFGFGCFKSLKMCPYEHYHCYLNIPDTSGRDSLFQAEARRCKEIIDCVNNNSKDETHFCIFDELYSGTNPEEAIMSAHAFMKYIMENNNVTCMLTTHYIKLCKKLNSNDKIQNCHMKIQKKKDQFNYTYLIKNGISKIRGGIKVLNDMNYPKEIMNLI
jgi:DNA mismatch repair ATPase MutS